MAGLWRQLTRVLLVALTVGVAIVAGQAFYARFGGTQVGVAPPVRLAPAGPHPPVAGPVERVPAPRPRPAPPAAAPPPVAAPQPVALQPPAGPAPVLATTTLPVLTAPAVHQPPGVLARLLARPVRGSPGTVLAGAPELSLRPVALQSAQITQLSSTSQTTVPRSTSRITLLGSPSSRSTGVARRAG